MALDRILLTRFRNHRDTAIEGTARFNLLVGENGAGKTNLLEAISLLAPGRGLRRAALADMAAKDGDGGFAISAALVGGDPGEDDPVSLGTAIAADRPGRRIVRVNGAPAPANRLAEWLAIGWLTPAMDRLFAEGPGARRRFLDRLVLALDPGHALHATRLDAALRERGRLLAHPAAPDPLWLDGLEAQIAEAGAAVSAGRGRMVMRLAAALHDLPDAPFARPALAYVAGGPQEVDALAAALREGRRRDRAAGRTLIGPQRDELAVTLAAKHQPAAECSTGEQKAMLIAITLAHAGLDTGLAERTRPRLLLLDEVAAHLDPLRREALFVRLHETGTQVWMTGTEVTPFAAMGGDAVVWEVRGGSVERV